MDFFFFISIFLIRLSKANNYFYIVAFNIDYFIGFLLGIDLLFVTCSCLFEILLTLLILVVILECCTFTCTFFSCSYLTYVFVIWSLADSWLKFLSNHISFLNVKPHPFEQKYKIKTIKSTYIVQTNFSANSIGSNLTKSVFKLSACCLAKLDIVSIAVESRAPSLGVLTEN